MTKVIEIDGGINSIGEEKNMNCNFKYLTLKSFKSNQSGMTIIEIIVATTIALILMTGVFQFFIIQTQNFNVGRMTAEMQQELRYNIQY